MTFEEILDQAMAMLQRRGRVTYRTLKRQFQLDDDALEDLKAELIDAQRVAADEDGNVLVWTGSAASPPTPAIAPERAPRTYTPSHLAEKILSSKAALEGERKQVTVLFADLKGSMELLADRDPEEARQLLDPVLERMMAAVHRYEGTVNQVLGDGIMALFGAPIAHEDHAARACYAALAMHAAIRAYAEEVRRAQGLTVQIRVGLNAGEVVVRAIGNDLHMDYSAVGQTTHLAARMEQLASPGTTLLTAETLRLVEGLVQVKALGLVPIKGLDVPVDVFELVGASALRGRFQTRVAGGLTRFVGRDPELAALHRTRERAEAGHGQVVAVVGEPGVGKSRLVYEFIHAHQTRGWVVLESASVSYGKATPYFPVLDLLKRYCHVEEPDDPRTVRAKVTGQVLTLDETLQDTLPALLSLLEVLPEDSPFRTLDPPQRRQRTLQALKRVLLRESQVQPLLLVFEDLHWIDAETQALLDSLVESLPTARLLLLVNYRPEYQHGWGSKTYYTQLRLDPLSPASADEFLQALLGDDPSLAPLTQLLIARTAGNPFFLEESVRTLLETGVLVREPGAYRLAQALPTIQVPATVQAVLAARIDRLPLEEKHVLQTAAVIGTEVPLPLLQAIADLPEEALHRGLAHLQAAEFLYETRLFPEREFTFKHALTHEVAYGSLLQERRRALHARIVEALEGLAGDWVVEQVERLAHHALRGEVWDKALAYLRQAGARALARSAHREAATYFDQAIRAVGRLPQAPETLRTSIDLRIDMRTALSPLGEHEHIQEHLRTGAQLATKLGDPLRLGRMVAFQAHHAWSTERLVRAIELAEQALTIAAAEHDVSLTAVATFFLGQACHGHGAYQRGIDVLSAIVEQLRGDLVGERFGMAVSVSVVARAWLTLCWSEVGRFREAVTCAQEAVDISDTVAQQPYSDFHARLALGVAHLRQGRLDVAIAALERAVRVARDGILLVMVRAGLGHLGYAYLLAGRVSEALATLAEALAPGEAIGFGFRPEAVVRLAEAQLRNGEVGEAERVAHEALERCRGNRQRGYEAETLRVLGEIALVRPDRDGVDASAYYRQAQSLASELGMRPLVAHCHLGLGTLYAKIGQQEQALTELSIAIELYRAMEMTFWLPQAEAALAQVEGRP